MGADVALIAPYPAPDAPNTTGVESYSQGLARALEQAGASVAVISPVRQGCPDDQTDGGVKIRRCFHKGPGGLLKAAGEVLRTGAPVAHLQHEAFLFGGPEAVPGLIGGLARLRQAGAGPVVTMHQVVSPRDVNRAFTQLHRVAMPAPVARVGLATVQGAIRRLAANVIVHGQGFGAALPGSTVLPIVGSRSQDGDERAESLRLDNGIGAGEFVVLCFGFVAPYKGVEAALAAAELAGPKIRLVVAGGEHPRLAGQGYLEGLVRRYGDVATFTGYVAEDDVSSWFAAADLVLLAYPQVFSCSGVLSLAIAHDTPVLPSRSMAAASGLPDELAVPLDPHLLAERLVHLAERGPDLENLARHTGRLGEGRSWSEVAERHLEIYEEVTIARRAASVRGRPRSAR
jgi:glycosyltransferase involved in cell wall biosynthesis